jgi:protein-S-isoprenylcysteine O-methyltransferase Ste14
LILGDKVNDIFGEPLRLNQYAGAIVFLTGFVIMMICIINFAVKGRGTLSPADPTRKLVVSGLYRFSRNPMYAGVMLILIGEAIFFQTMNLWIYSFVVFIAFNIFIVLVEEPRLRKDFGEEYKTYCNKVRRWI